MSRGTLVKNLICDNAGEHQSKLQKACEKEKVTLDYIAPHMPQLNVIIERIFNVIKEGALDMLLNVKINDTSQKILWEEAVNTYEHVRNSMANTGSTKSPFENFYGEKPKIIGSFLEFGRIYYVNKRVKNKKKITDKTYKAIMVGYVGNNTREMYKLYNPEIKRFIMTRYVKRAEWKMTDTAETLKIFRDTHKGYLVSGI